VLLLGETGTGKVTARAPSMPPARRADKPFLSVNCGAIPEPLIESELFGHKPGAFTGAAREGSMAASCRRTAAPLFLDEIGDMRCTAGAPPERHRGPRVLPLGGTKAIPVDVRIISATQHDPVELIAKGSSAMTCTIG